MKVQKPLNALIPAKPVFPGGPLAKFLYTQSTLLVQIAISSARAFNCYAETLNTPNISEHIS